MKAQYEKKEHSRGELRVTVDGEQWTQAQEKAFRKLAQDVQIKGFRKGKAPEAMVRKVVTPAMIMEEAVRDVAQPALDFGLDENKDIRLVDRPLMDVEQDAISPEAVTILFNLTVYPEVALGDYKSLPYKEDKVSVLKKDVDEQIQTLRQQNAEEVLKEDGAVEKGDIAVLDFEGFKDGVAFDGGKGTAYPLEIGSGSFIPGFEDQIVGMKTDEEKDIQVTFPSDYSVKDLAGAPVTFHVKVDSIKQKKLPELNDEFAAECGYGDEVKTVADLEKYLKEQLRAQRKQAAEEKATDELLDKLCEICPVEIPEVMIDDEVKQTFEDYTDRIQRQGISMDMYYRIMSTDEAGFKEQIRPEAEKKVRIRLILEAVADDMGIDPTEQDLQEEYETMSKQYGMEVDKIKELVPPEYLKGDVKIRHALNDLKQQGAAAKEKAEPAGKPAAKKSAAKPSAAKTAAKKPAAKKKAKGASSEEK